MTPANDVLFSSELWKEALEKFGRDTRLSVKLFAAGERIIFGPVHSTPLFQLFEEKGYDPGIFAQCARQCLAQTSTRPAVVVSEVYGLAVVGTSLMLEGEIVGAAVGGYAFVDFSQLSEIQRLARDAGIKFERLWAVAREQKPVPRQRLVLNGELLQVLGDALLRENHRTRQYEEAVEDLQRTAIAKAKAHMELQRTEGALRESQEQLARELTATRQLQSASALLIEGGNTDAFYPKIVDAAVAIMGSDAASMQMFDEDHNALHLLAWRGFGPEFGIAFKVVGPDTKTACSVAMRSGHRVIVPDVETCDFIAVTPTLEEHRRMGVRAVQSTPLFSRSGRMLGMISTHWHSPHTPTESDLRQFDILARQAADLLERKRTEESLRESDGKYRTLFEAMAEGFCIIEKVEGEACDPLDFRYVEANPAFAAQTGVSDVVGKTIRQAFPGEPEEWFLTYDNVLKTGQPIWFERGLITHGKVLELYAFRIEDEAHRRVAVVFKDITERKQAEEALRMANDELESRVRHRTQELQTQVMETERAEDSLKDLTGRLLQVQDEERRRMARELHDSAGQTLVALSINLATLESGSLKTGQVAKRLSESQRLVETLTREIRTLSYLLHPPLLDEAGLDSALRWYIEGFSERSKIQVDLELAKDFGRLSGDLEIAIFRLIQESLTNIHRHSGSTSAKIRIARSETQVEIEIADNGKGIAPEKLQKLTTARAGVGMRGMRERVRQFKGTFVITSNRNGTKVAVVLPAAQHIAVA